MKNSIKKTIFAIVLACTASIAYAQAKTCMTHTECSGGRCATIKVCY